MSTHSLSSDVKSAGDWASRFCIGASVCQMALLFHERFGNSPITWLFTVAVLAAMLGSQIIIQEITQALKAGQKLPVIFFGLFFVLVTEGASITVSQLSFNSNIQRATVSSASSSEEAQHIREKIEGYKRQKEILTDQYSDTKSTHTSNRGAISAELEQVNANIDEEMARLQKVKSVQSDKALSELPFGISLADLALAMGLMLSGIPASHSIISAAMSWGDGKNPKPEPRPSTIKSTTAVGRAVKKAQGLKAVK